ncbi:uncharacterized protein LOC117187923 isoform X2 [Drosophila miranda]|uniref:uncharacterized protein LOC117187923 isoform X2 n=1 Tax=Drosophila miranda TaxID=7229 RepID=UPI00143F3074|nr:uncharacterized protein LOC117187923 isoform X2 [Drosophila miranda]
MFTEPKSVEPKVSTKEAECQSSDCETSQQEPVSQVSSPKGGRVGIFNAEDFLSRAQMNDKINNILRSPTKPTNGVRQRSVYTNNPPPGINSELTAAAVLTARQQQHCHITSLPSPVISDLIFRLALFHHCSLTFRL